MSQNTSISKNLIRQEFLKKRNELSTEHLKESSFQVCKKLAQSYDTARVTTFAGYAAFRNEINLAAFISVCVHEKVFFLPKFQIALGRYVFMQIQNMETDLTIGKYGIKEPLPHLLSLSIEEAQETIDVWLVPGAVFDTTGNRIGMGGGFYDRFLMNNSGLKIGIAHDFQVVDNKLPVANHDIKMDMLVTDQRILDFRNT